MMRNICYPICYVIKLDSNNNHYTCEDLGRYDQLTPKFQPENLFSPTEVLRRQQGNCFDFSNLLCSLLLGAGYDAYCVCGYATKEV